MLCDLELLLTQSFHRPHLHLLQLRRRLGFGFGVRGSGLLEGAAVTVGLKGGPAAADRPGGGGGSRGGEARWRGRRRTGGGGRWLG
jgi:hypothetical protein